MITVGKLIKELQKFDDNVLVNIGYTEELIGVMNDICDGMYLYLTPKFEIYNCKNNNNNNNKKINLIVDYYCPDALSDEELKKIEGPYEHHYQFEKEIEIK